GAGALDGWMEVFARQPADMLASTAL
ncbi:MAG: hypothetical protein RL722_2247, partial [Pseudomonadota bacterium]